LPENVATLAREAAPTALRNIPVIILSAESASPNERAEHEALARDAQAHVEVVSGSGHWVQLDRPDVVINAIRDIINQVQRN